MKKLKLKALNLGADEILTRAQLKNVVGGDATFSVQTIYRCCSVNDPTDCGDCLPVNYTCSPEYIPEHC